MFGVPSVDLSLCRVLELGCADGTNLLPHAAEFPESHFVGVDLAVDSLATTRQAARQLDLQPLVQHQFLAELCFVLIHPFDGFEFELFDREPLTLPFEQGAVTVIDPFIRAALRELMERWPATTTVDEPRSLARRKTQPR